MQAQPWPKKHSPAVVKPFFYFPKEPPLITQGWKKPSRPFGQPQRGLWFSNLQPICKINTWRADSVVEGEEFGGGTSTAFARVGSGWKLCWLKVNFCVISSALSNTAHFVSGWMSKNWNESQMFFHFFRLLFSTDCRLWCLSKKPALD